MSVIPTIIGSCFSILALFLIWRVVKDDRKRFQREVEELRSALSCYDSDLSKEDKWVLNASKLSYKIRDIEGRFSEIYTFIGAERVESPYGKLRKRD